ncbi:hypothetical protein GALL_325790 [mine drainage metagenome]|uniref:Uncharacterized protein n=1 Tax=mine drainage metagenome TaxID=410659 RepID=A0A1J5R788_9ZZZZ
MKRKLWTLLADRQPVAVVAADCLPNAWVIVKALQDSHDVPVTGGAMEIVPCPRTEASRTTSRARRLGCADTFLACLQRGYFILSFGGLSLDTLQA